MTFIQPCDVRFHYQGHYSVIDLVVDGLTLIWVLHHLAQQPSPFCQIPISPGKIGQIMVNGRLKIQVNPTYRCRTRLDTLY